jgi:biopolymer transport protein ExbD
MTGSVPQQSGLGAGAGGSPAAPPSARARPAGSVVKFKAALRRAKRRNAKEPEIDFLNITAMLDLMTIILVFVLKSLATSQTAQSDDLKLPVSVLTSEPSEEGVIVTISKTQLLVGDGETPIAELASREQLAQTGLDAQTSEAIVVADGTTPYRVLIEILFTLGASEFGKYHLMVVSGKK